MAQPHITHTILAPFANPDGSVISTAAEVEARLVSELEKQSAMLQDLQDRLTALESRLLVRIVRWFRSLLWPSR